MAAGPPEVKQKAKGQKVMPVVTRDCLYHMISVVASQEPVRECCRCRMLYFG